MENYDICVIGAGYGGATVAALLARAGCKVALPRCAIKPLKGEWRTMYSPLLALDEVGMLDWMSQFALPEAIIDELWPDLKHHVVGQEPCGARQISSMSHDSGFNLAAMVEQDLAG